MIRLWLSREKGIAIREQLSAQLLLGILSRSLAPGERLPSVRELARRLKVHPNTVSAAYQDLAARGWLDSRRGSGMFVTEAKISEPEGGIDGFARAWVEEGKGRGFTIDALESALARVRQEIQPDGRASKFLVVHADRPLADILATEIAEAVGCPVPFAGLEDAAALLTPETFVLVTAAVAPQVLQALKPPHHRIISLNSIEKVIAGRTPPSSTPLIAIVSRSESVLQWTSTILPALGLPLTNLLLRNPANRGWQDGLAVCDVVVADVKAGRELPKTITPAVIRIVSDDFLRELVTAKKV